MAKKVVLITGGSRGIGAAIVKVLLKNYNVLAPTRTELDLSSKKSIEEFIQKNQKLSLYALINNAGVNNPEFVDQLTDKNIDQTLQVNLVAPILLCRGFVPLLKKNKISHIVNISSIFGLVARAKQVLYATTKFGLNGVTKALALELAPDNILVNSVCPGFVDTDLTRRNPPQKNKKLAVEVPLGRFATPFEIANLVEFLISDKNTYITGETIVIDGGYTSKWIWMQDLLIKSKIRNYKVKFVNSFNFIRRFSEHSNYIFAIDRKVYFLYEEKIFKNLDSKNLILLEAIETTKTLGKAAEIYQILAKFEAKRNLTLISVGG